GLDGLEQVFSDEVRLLRKILVLLLLGSPIACHHKNRLCPSGICDVDIKVSVTDYVRLRKVDSKLLLSAEQHSGARLTTVASCVGMVRAKVDGVQLRAVTS